MGSTACTCSSESHSTTVGDCGRLPKSVQDAIDTVELLLEMWITVGIAVPIFLTVLTAVLALMGDGSVPLDSWLAPIVTVGVTGLVLVCVEYVGSPHQHAPNADEDVRAEIDAQLQMCMAVALVSGLVGAFVFGVIDSTIFTELASLPPADGVTPEAITSLTVPMYATMLIQAGGTGLVAGAITDASLPRRVGYAMALVTIAGGIILV